MNNLVSNRVEAENNKLALLVNNLNSKNPLEILSKGYSKLEKNGKRIATIKEVEKDDEIVCNLIDGKIIANIKEIVSK